MSEERRMITEEQWSLGASEWSWLEFELAPSEDWMPYCNDRAYEELCSGREDEYLGDPKMCQQCPYRMRN